MSADYMSITTHFILPETQFSRVASQTMDSFLIRAIATASDQNQLTLFRLWVVGYEFREPFERQDL